MTTGTCLNQQLVSHLESLEEQQVKTLLTKKNPFHHESISSKFMTFDEQHVFDLSWHLALYSVGSNEGRNPCTCTCATRGTWRGARWISATIEPLELSLICICDGGEVAEASGWVRLILVATVCLRWMMLVVTVVIKELEYQGPGIKENRNAIDEYYPQNTVALQNGSIV